MHGVRNNMSIEKENRDIFKGNFNHGKTKQISRYSGDLQQGQFTKREKFIQPSVTNLIRVPISVPSPKRNLIHGLKVPQLTTNSVKTPASKLSQPQKVCFKKNLLGVNQACSMVSIKNVVEYERLFWRTREFKNISMLFSETMYIKRIDKIKNPFLQRSFELKKEFHYNDVQPMVLFHGTKYKFLDEISTFNFDWRLSGLETGHRYGKGVNFTLDPEFAGNFCDMYSKRKIIIVADVLVIKGSRGYKDMNVPPDGFDTATRKNKRTFVKFGDSEFLPKYVVTFDWNFYI